MFRAERPFTFEEEADVKKKKKKKKKRYTQQFEGEE